MGKKNEKCKTHDVMILRLKVKPITMRNIENHPAVMSHLNLLLLMTKDLLKKKTRTKVHLSFCHISSFSTNFELCHYTTSLLHFCNSIYGCMKDMSNKQSNN